MSSDMDDGVDAMRSILGTDDDSVAIRAIEFGAAWLRCGGHHPPWVEDIDIASVTDQDIQRLNRHADLLLWHGTGQGTPVGILDHMNHDRLG